MELWLSAEVQEDVSNELRRARKAVERAVSLRVTKDYGADIMQWALITILRPYIPEGWGEVCKYHRQDRSAEFRLIIDYTEFKSASPEKQIQMLVHSILRSIYLFPRLNVANFDIDWFRRDIVDAAVTEGWLVPQDG